MRTLSRLLLALPGLALILFTLGGCATQYTVSQDELQRSIDQRLPVKSAIAFSDATGELLAKTVHLDVGRAYPGKVAVTASGSLSLPTVLGELHDDYNCAFSGKIRFNPQDRGIYLSDIAISSLEFKSLSQLLPAQWYESATEEAKRMLISQLTAGPIYTVQDKTIAEAWFRKHGSAINVEQGRLVFLLGGNTANTSGASAGGEQKGK